MQGPGPAAPPWRKCYVTSAFSGVPNSKRGEKITIGCLTPAFSGAHKRAEVLCNPYILGGPQRQARVEDQKWVPHPCFLGGGGHKWVEVLRNPCILGGAQRQVRGELASSRLPSRGPKRQWKCYATPAFSGVPNAMQGGGNHN